ncbi:coronin-1C-like isoform X2 [Bradysia coprophila]|uniref:coronin-1C-like isoform X2 n=1 Tax=Bradysia coprophila TaxID=38358 RepID=UPI00187DB12E|nr:coronin-1C-like isoform X2 [Bradysia coprophila]
MLMLNGVKSSDSINVQKLLIENHNNCVLSMTGNNITNSVDSRACSKPDGKLWFRGVRPSKFRHIYGQSSRKESCYTDISVVRSGNDGNFCAVNPILLAIVADTAFVVIPLSQAGRIDFQCCKVIGHTGQILDLKWNPFNDNLIASASDDCTIRIWEIPTEGLTSNLTESLVELQGHMRKVLQVEWHPTANNVLISIGFDQSIIIWDVSNQTDQILKTINCHNDMIYSLAINRDGSLLATTSKDRKLRIIEPRTAIVVSEGTCHLSSKCSKVTFLDNGKVLTTGFSRHSDRQYAIWDQHDLKKPLALEVMDSSSGVVTPYFDYDTKVLYLAGKGDGNIRYYEIVEEQPYIYYLNQFLSGQPQKALGFMPKRGLNTNQCEVFRFYKLHATGNICEPISMIVPRKSTLFQTDLYPDTVSDIPATNAQEWLSGRNAQPIMMSMQTGKSIMLKNNKQQKHDNKQSTNDSNYNNNLKQVHNGNNGNNENDNQKYDNNSKKFAFLAQQTIPDYRPQQINDKNQKTSTNQSTKFHQLQAIFGHQGANIKDIANLQNNLISSTNSSLENLNLINSENELRKAFTLQTEEIKNLKNQLSSSEQRVKELEAELHRLQLQLNRK